MCRRWGGGPFLSIDCTTDTEIAGREHIAEYDSSAWAARGFCKTCGTHLYYRLKSASSFAIPAGLFSEQGHLTLTTQIFIDRKPPFYDFANNTQKLTEEQVIAQYAPK